LCGGVAGVMVVVMCCGDVADVVMLLLVGWCSWPSKSTLSDLFIPTLVPWWLDISIHAYGE
jgi:hypothetical protein